MTKLFISHASEDKEFVRALIQRLNTMELDCWFDANEIRSGDSIPEKINEGLRTSTHGVLVLSPSYLGEHKYWTWEELWALINKESAQGRRLLIPIRFNLDYSKLVEEIPLLAHRLSIDFYNNPNGAADEIALVVRRSTKSARPLSGGKTPTEGLPSRHNVPLARPTKKNFVGRDAFLAELLDSIYCKRDADFSEIDTVVISGIPGSGKSSVAYEIVYKIGRNFVGGVYWLDARSPLTLVTSAKQIIGLQQENLKIDADTKSERIFELVRQYFESHPCLIVFDALDVKDVAPDLHRLIPRTGLSRILVTTKTERLDVPFRAALRPLPDLDEAAASLILLQFQKNRLDPAEEKFVSQLAEKLGRLPLALQIAVRYIRKHTLSFRAYVEKLSDSDSKWRGLGSPVDFLPSVNLVLQLAFDDLDNHGNTGQLAKKILKRCAAIDVVGGKLYRWEDGDLANRFPLGLAASVGISKEDEDKSELFEEAVQLAEQAGLLRFSIQDENDLWIHSLTLKFLRDLFVVDDANYLIFWVRTDWAQGRFLMEAIGWYNTKSQISRYLDALQFLEKTFEDKAFDVIDTILEMEPFCNEIDGEVISEKALTILSLQPSSSQEEILHFRITKAYSAYSHGRTSSAESQYEEIWRELVQSPAPLRYIDTLDFSFYYGCLLLELGGDTRTTKAGKLWSTGIGTIMHVLEQAPSNSKSPFWLQMRLCRLMNATLEVFPELITDARKTLRQKLVDDVDAKIGSPFSINAQLLKSRRPFVPFFLCTALLEDK